MQNKACPLLAPMAEEGWTNNEIAKLAVHEYIKDIKDIEALILGCTHYPLFKEIIERELKNVFLSSSEEQTFAKKERIVDATHLSVISTF